jgi:hypothetical protein
MDLRGLRRYLISEHREGVRAPDDDKQRHTANTPYLQLHATRRTAAENRRGTPERPLIRKTYKELDRERDVDQDGNWRCVKSEREYGTAAAAHRAGKQCRRAQYRCPGKNERLIG